MRSGTWVANTLVRLNLLIDLLMSLIDLLLHRLVTLFIIKFVLALNGGVPNLITHGRYGIDKIHTSLSFLDNHVVTQKTFVDVVSRNDTTHHIE